MLQAQTLPFCFISGVLREHEDHDYPIMQFQGLLNALKPLFSNRRSSMEPSSQWLKQTSAKLLGQVKDVIQLPAKALSDQKEGDIKCKARSSRDKIPSPQDGVGPPIQEILQKML